MECALDFLAYQYASDVPAVQSDGFLTVEFAEMEKLSQKAAETNTVNDFWCALAAQPVFQCLDIGAPSTLGDSLNVSAFDLTTDSVFTNANFIYGLYETASNVSTNLFGQYDTCDGKRVGDGLINVFDIATLLAYIFKDYKYADLSPYPAEVITVQGRDRLVEQCTPLVSRVQFHTDYAADTCLYFDSSSSRRLQELMAGDLERQWLMRPSLPEAPVPQHRREWVPLPLHSLEVVHDRILAPATVSFTPDFAYREGRWYTVRMASVALRLHASFTGLPTQHHTKLSNRIFDGTPPLDPTVREVRFTRFCEYGQCDMTCASIDTAHASRHAMVYDTLELVQRPVLKACPFEVHVWVPQPRASACVSMEYIAIADGVRGQFAHDISCRAVSPPPTTQPLAPPPSSPRSLRRIWHLWPLAVGFFALSCGLVTLYGGVDERRRRTHSARRAAHLYEERLARARAFQAPRSAASQPGGIRLTVNNAGSRYDLRV